ncbi:DUF998 domain-containing protein [Carboxylicivirga taeanensis]|uniref:DUF998 domain-containing protein n=1 Tax=Carboxylicivirga taeanensis TaxID=1416875 RepID=UPI003F6E2356
MKNLLIKQAIYVPILYFGTVIIASLFASNYSHIGQHASELAVNNEQTAVKIFTIGIFTTGLALIFYSLGLLLKFKRQFLLTALLIGIFGLTFLFGACYKIGSPWHGLYGIGLSIMLLPLAFLYELRDKNRTKATETLSILATVVIFLYFWAMIAGLDPMEKRGLTQRLFGIVVFGYIAFSAYTLAKLKPEHNPL